MRTSGGTSVLVLAVEKTPASDLLRVADRNDWPVRRPASAREGYQEFLRERPRVVVIQVSDAEGEDIELIRRVRSGSVPTSLVAAATAHDEGLERSVRISGVDVYVGGTADAALLESTVAALLRREMNDAPVLHMARQGMRRNHSLLLLTSTKQERRAAGRRTPPPAPPPSGRREYAEAGQRHARPGWSSGSSCTGARTWIVA